jgi:hypothetical protein
VRTKPNQHFLVVIDISCKTEECIKAKGGLCDLLRETVCCVVSAINSYCSENQTKIIESGLKRQHREEYQKYGCSEYSCKSI